MALSSTPKTRKNSALSVRSFSATIVVVKVLTRGEGESWACWYSGNASGHITGYVTGSSFLASSFLE